MNPAGTPPFRPNHSLPNFGDILVPCRSPTCGEEVWMSAAIMTMNGPCHYGCVPESSRPCPDTLVPCRKCGEEVWKSAATDGCHYGCYYNLPRPILSHPPAPLPDTTHHSPVNARPKRHRAALYRLWPNDCCCMP